MSAFQADLALLTPVRSVISGVSPPYSTLAFQLIGLVNSVARRRQTRFSTQTAVDSGANLDTLVIFADSSPTGVLQSSLWSSNWDPAGNWEDANGWDDNDLYDID